MDRYNGHRDGCVLLLIAFVALVLGGTKDGTIVFFLKG